MVVPMLNEDEWLEMSAALTKGLRNIKARRAATGESVAEATTDEQLQMQYAEALSLYKQLTGFHETTPLAVWHHRASLYGPPCATCGKPLRTPLAKLCAACGARRGV